MRSLLLLIIPVIVLFANQGLSGTNTGGLAQTALDLDINAVEYAIISSDAQEKSGALWIANQLALQNKLVDPVWGGLYLGEENGQYKYGKDTVKQALALQMDSALYGDLGNKQALKIAKVIISYLTKFLISEEGAFFAGQAAYSDSNAANKKYYQLNDEAPAKLGIPKINTHIYSRDNGLMIVALTNYYRVTGDQAALEKALAATRWVTNQLMTEEGGFRHEKEASDTFYLSDTLAMGQAFLALYQTTTDPRYLQLAENAAKFINQYFITEAGFISVANLNKSAPENLATKINANENAEIVRLTSLLFSYTGDKHFDQMRQSAFHSLSTDEELAKKPPALFLMAKYRIENEPVHLVIVGFKQDMAAKNLYSTALTQSILYSRIDWLDNNSGSLPNSTVRYPMREKAIAYVCHGFACSLPIYNSTDLLKTLKNIHTSIPTPSASFQSANFKSSINPSSDAEKLLKGKNWLVIIFGFIGFGLLLSFTPCVLPLVPIMASIIVGQTIGVKKQRTFLLCLTYVLSMSVTYAFLGLLAGIFGVYLQVYLQTTWMIVAFSLLFFALGISMLGAGELRLPRLLQQKISEKSALQEGGSYLGVMGMGMLGTLIISPCVTAPLAGILSFITETSNYVLGAVSLFCLSLGMGMPLLIISLFSKNILPRAAKWNDQIKIFFGLILLAVFVWLMSRVISFSNSILLWSAFLILVSIYMGLSKKKTKSLFSKFFKTATLLIFLYAVVLFFYAFYLKANLCATPNKANVEVAALFKNINNQADLSKEIDFAKARHLPVLLDFTANWCAACQQLERNVFSDPTVRRMLNKFVALRVDLTTTNENNMALAHQFSVVGPPVVIFFDASGKLSTLRATGDYDANEFMQMLAKAAQE